MKIHFWKFKPSYARAVNSDLQRIFKKSALYKLIKKYPAHSVYVVLTILAVLFLSIVRVYAAPEPLIEVGIARTEIRQMSPYKAPRPQKVSLAVKEVTKPTTAPNYASGDSVWDRLAECESGGNWAINSGNGFYGGLQFDLQTWQSNGGKGYPHENSREEQIRVAERLRANRGYSPWPSCSQKLGLQ